MDDRRINLLPPEIAERRKARQRVASLGVGVLVLIGLLGMVYVSQEIRLRGQQNALDRQLDDNAGLQARLDQLTQFDELQRELDRKERLLESLTENEVRWSVVLADVSLVIPDTVWLTDFSGQVNLTPDENDNPLGTISVNGTTFTHPDVARWLVRIGTVDGFANPYLSLSQKVEEETAVLVNFTSSLELSEGAFRRNQPGARRSL
ncbi:MAG TPA: PilN domain-containing protein [Actinomycetota bacterium]